ncbi:MAG TPA: M20/M25/M40 family metallo-hydrolase [Fimbriimonadaceae bacterium]|nr:M20/M25/M40 family metallo-hydrolase [Fimbriimonadaceae bacterium]HRJ96976.1 M20/M25/M40 family metallo-hydrolase [Fimbriimonadaceae bacterium]
MISSRFVIAFFIAGCCCGASAQADQATVQRIVQHGKNENQVMRHLWHLSKNIGPRLTGSPKLLQACDWTMLRFKEFGLKNVHLDYWGEVPVGFERGERQTGRMVAPYEWDFEFTTPAWSPGTGVKRRGVAILEPTTMAEYEKVKGKLRWAWLISQGGTRQPGSERAQVDALIAKAGIAGRVSASRSDLVVTGGRYSGLDYNNLPKDVRITIRKKDMDRIMYSLQKGKEVKLEFDIQQRFLKGPKPVYNVVAEIPGTERPDEVVIVSGHLDSWDGPGSEGTCDNGTGTMVALEAARILMATGAKPKRTIRFILWTGEEQGLLGSRAYVQNHRDQLDKISAVLVDDGGTNYQGGVTCTAAMEPLIRMALQPAMDAFPEFPMRIQIVERIPRGGGSDHAPFNGVGVPGFFWFETGRANYNYVHHTQHDKFEEAIPEYLVQSSVNTAAAAYILACAETMLPREQPAAAPASGSGR